MLVASDIPNSDVWARYSAKYATLPLLPAQLALPAPVWSIVSSTLLLYLQPSLLAALADQMRWTFEPRQQTEITMRALVQVHTRPLPLKLTSDFYVSTSNSPSVQVQPQWEL